jgi:large subunit ribosomal protein L23
MNPLSPRDVVLRPLVTEKSLRVSERRNAYTFAVDPRANKVQIRRAVESLFHVKVLGVRTDVRPGKPKRFGWAVKTTPSVKRAVVTLQAGDTIEFY